MEGLANVITGLFDVVVSIILGGCQFIGSIILFMFLFIIFIIIGYAVVVMLIEIAKPDVEVWDVDDLFEHMEEMQEGKKDDN